MNQWDVVMPLYHKMQNQAAFTYANCGTAVSLTSFTPYLLAKFRAVMMRQKYHYLVQF